MLSNKTITLLISGSIAAYKCPEIVRELKRQGAIVNIAMSQSAREFVTPLTLQTVSGFPVVTELFELQSELEIGHISLADRADAVVIAPATANILAKAARGICDDLLSTIILATRCPLVFFPAMNVNMWQNQITQENVEILRKRGHVVIEPDVGSLACGWNGSGRLPETLAVIEEIESVLTPKMLDKTRVIVSAGPTQELIDPVRFLSNRSSGKMGYALAKVARQMGAEVTLISGPSALAAPRGVKLVKVNTASEMHEEIFQLASSESPESVLQAIYMAAAVSDHRPAVFSKEKLKMDKSDSYSLQFDPAIDILADLGAKREVIEKNSKLRMLLVGFAAETGDLDSLIKSARSKLISKKADMIVGNFAEESFGKDNARVWLVGRNGKEEEVGSAGKDLVSEKIIRFSLKI